MPRDRLPQIALVGRSNVGKSSLINALCRQKIARTSAAAGKTRLANIYRVELEGLGGPGRRTVYLVDLPGYGYARGGADSAKELAAVAEAYVTGERLRPARPFDAAQGRLAPVEERGAKSPCTSERGWGAVRAERSRPSARSPRPLVMALLVVDSRHPGLAADLHAHAWLQRIGAALHLVATKVDKLSRAGRVRNLTAIERAFGEVPLAVSATTGEGIEDVWKLIAALPRGTGRTEETK